MKKTIICFIILLLFCGLLLGCDKAQEDKIEYGFPEIKPLSVDGIDSISDICIERAFGLPENSTVAEIDFEKDLIIIKQDDNYGVYNTKGQKLTQGVYTSYEKIFGKYCFYGENGGAIYSPENKSEKRFGDNRFIALKDDYYLKRDGTSYRLQLFDKNDTLVRVLYDSDSEYEAFICDNFIVYNNRKLNAIQLYDLNDDSFSKEFPNTGYAKLYYLGQGTFLYIDSSGENTVDYLYDVTDGSIRKIEYRITAVYNVYNTADISIDQPYSVYTDIQGVFISDNKFGSIIRLDGTNLSFIDGITINDAYNVDGKVYVTKINTDGIPQKSVMIFENCSSLVYNDGVFTYNVIDGEEVFFGAESVNGNILFENIYSFISMFIQDYAIGVSSNDEQKEYYRLYSDGSRQSIDKNVDKIYSVFYSSVSTENIILYSFAGEELITIPKKNISSSISNMYSDYLGGYFTIDDTLYLIKTK